MDTTGLAYRREDRPLRFRRGEEVRWVRGHARLLALMRWDRGRRLLWPWGGVVGEGYAPDPRLGGEALRWFPLSEGLLLAEAGFDGREVWEALRGEGVRLVIRLRGGGEAREEARVRAQERRPWTAMARAFLELIAYGLRVLLSLLPPPPGYKAIY